MGSNSIDSTSELFHKNNSSILSIPSNISLSTPKKYKASDDIMNESDSDTTTENNITSNNESSPKLQEQENMDESKKFSCSTPVKFYIGTGLLDENESFTVSKAVIENENGSGYAVPEHINMKDKANHLLMDVSLNQNLNYCDGDGGERSFVEKNSSLIEFEQNEKNVETTTSPSLKSLPRLPNNPIKQMEMLLDKMNSDYVSPSFAEDERKNEINRKVDYENKFEELIAKNVGSKYKNYHEGVNGSFTPKSKSDLSLESRLQHEILRRQHCEKQIYELNENILELQEQLAVLSGIDKQREQYVKNMESAVKKILKEWKEKESKFEKKVQKINDEKSKTKSDETKLKMRIDILDQELKKVSSELIKEKVKSQEYSLEISNLTRELNEHKSGKIDLEKTINDLKARLDTSRNENKTLDQELDKLRVDVESINVQSKKIEEEYNSKINQLNSSNQQLIKQNEKIRNEYETLIEETKVVVNESEKQYNHLIKAIEIEKLAKDSIQVEMNVLEEKYENTIKSLNVDCENKIKCLKNEFNEKEKSLNESHKSELNKLVLEADKLKSKYFDDLQAKIKEYEVRITDLNLKMDSYRNEIERLKRANCDLENDRNTIRQNLKQMLEIQMREAMQLLGVNTSATPTLSINTKTNSNPTPTYSSSNSALISNISPNEHNYRSSNNLHSFTNNFDNEYTHANFIEKPNLNYNQLKTSSPKQQIIPEFRKVNSMNESSSTTPKTEEFASTLASKNRKSLLDYNSLNSSTLTVKNPNETSNHITDLMIANIDSKIAKLESAQDLQQKEGVLNIKDSFILNQIDLINQYYQIDNKALAVASSKLTFSSNNNSNNSNSTSSNQPRLEKPVYSSDSTNKSISTSSSSSLASLNDNDYLMKAIIKPPNGNDLDPAFDYQNKKIDDIADEISNFKNRLKYELNDDPIKYDLLKFDDNQINSQRSRSLSSTHSLSSNYKNLNLNAEQLNQTNNSSNINASRADELRHFIEILLTKSPSKNQELANKAVKRSVSVSTNNINQKPQLINKQTKEKNELSISRCVSTQNISTGLKNSKPIEMIAQKTETSASDTDKLAKPNLVSAKDDYKKFKKLAFEQLSMQQDESPGFEDDENGEINYLCNKHDLSDLDLGYTKRHPLEYYDDVKRTLTFDDDDDDDDDNDDSDEGVDSSKKQIKNTTVQSTETSNLKADKKNSSNLLEALIGNVNKEKQLKLNEKDLRKLKCSSANIKNCSKNQITQKTQLQPATSMGSLTNNQASSNSVNNSSKTNKSIKRTPGNVQLSNSSNSLSLPAKKLQNNQQDIASQVDNNQTLSQLIDQISKSAPKLVKPTWK